MIKKYVSLGLLAAMLSGCATQYGGQSRYSFHIPDKKVELQYERPKNIGLEDMLKSVQKTRRCVKHDKKMHLKYHDVMEEVNDFVEKKKYNEAGRKIRTAVDSLAREKFSTRNQYMDTFKNYSYKIVESVSPVYEETSSTEGIVGGIISLPFVAAFSVVGTVLGQDEKVKNNIEQYKNLFKGERRKIKDGYDRIYKVMLYYDKRIRIK